MKVCKVTLREAGPGLYRVENYTNTTQLTIGMMVPRERVAEWCGMKRVNVVIAGRVEDDEEQLELPAPTCQDVQRVDALQLAAQTIKDTGPGENPF